MPSLAERAPEVKQSQPPAFETGWLFFSKPNKPEPNKALLPQDYFMITRIHCFVVKLKSFEFRVALLFSQIV
jgi:hypothetical protein